MKRASSKPVEPQYTNAACKQRNSGWFRHGRAKGATGDLTKRLPPPAQLKRVVRIER